MYISLSFAIIQCNGNNNEFTHHHAHLCMTSLFFTSHFVTECGAVLLLLQVMWCCCWSSNWQNTKLRHLVSSVRSMRVLSLARGDTLRGNWCVQCKCVFWNLDALKFESICWKITSQLSVWGLWHSSSFLYFWLVSVSNPVWPPGQCQRSGQCWRLMRVTTCGHAPVWGPGSFPRCRAQCHSGWSVSASPGATIMSRDMCHYLMMSWSEHLQWQQWMCHCHHLLLLDEWPHNKCFLPGDSFVRLLQCIRWPSLSFKLSKFLSQSCFASPQQRFSPSETIQL